MAFSLKKWIGSMLFSAFMAEYNENLEEIEGKFGEVGGAIEELETHWKLVQLWSGNLNTNETTITLSQPASDFDLIMVIGTGNQYAHYGRSLILPWTGRNDTGFGVSVGGGGATYCGLSTSAGVLQFEWTTTTTIKSIGGFGAANRIVAVWGIKI